MWVDFFYIYLCLDSFGFLQFYKTLAFINNRMKILLLIAVLPFITLALDPICQMCHLAVETVRKAAPTRPTIPFLQKIAVQYCLTKKLEDKTVCEGAIKGMTPFLITSVWRHHTNPHVLCQQAMLCRKEYVKRNVSEDINNILNGKPHKEWQNATGSRTLKILHISDLHPDLFYTPGAIVDCNQPVCCRPNITAKPNGSNKVAGFWGSIGTCDLPLKTFELFLKEIQRMDVDAIIWTGDNTPHDIWQQTQSYNLNFTNLLAQMIKEHTNATVIPAMGNHESWPVNVYDYHRDREDTLKAGLAQAWHYWMDENAIKMQRERGYFKMVYPRLNNLKVLSINTQAGNDMNWFLLEDPSDPGDMLKWIEQELKQAQKLNQMVYIIGHIPPKQNLNDWAIRYNALVDRYAYNIRGQFFGHTHSDHLSFFPEFANKANISTATLSNYYLVAPSITTYSDRTPQYRVMDVDFDTLQVTDYAQYRLDLRKFTSETDHAKFQLFYKFKQTYGIKDMSVKGGMTQLRNKLRDNKDILKLFSHNKSGGLSQGKSDLSVFCDTTTAPQFSSECMGSTFKKKAFEKAAGPWRQIKHKE